MESKEIVLEKLGWETLGKKGGRLVGYNQDGTVAHCNYGAEVAMEVVRVTDKRAFVLARYDEDAHLYRVAYDPNPNEGRIKTIVNVYCKPKSADNQKED